MTRVATAAAFVATVYAANWALKHWGTVPVGFGWRAPAGVYFAGLGFLLRDLLHEVGGRAWVLGAILVGALLSYWLGANTTLPNGVVSIAIASGVAFAVSELCDFGVYTPLREHTLPGAVGLSQVAGAVVDSLLFLWLAGLLTWSLLWGQLWGKTVIMLPFVALLLVARPRLRFAR